MIRPDIARFYNPHVNPLRTMSHLLLLDTSGPVCELGLAKGQDLVVQYALHMPNAHSRSLGIMVEQALSTAEVSKSSLSAIGLTIGPGSYTGLRVGLSFAKGMAYTLGIPLLAIDTLEALYESYRTLAHPADFYIPMLDARRMEVYGAIYNAEGTVLQKSVPMVMDEKSFRELGDANIVCFGSGAGKLKKVFATRPNVQIAGGAIPIMPGLFQKAEQAYASGDVADLAYLEPEYLKEYKAGTPKKLV